MYENESNVRGFTLIELMVTIAVMGILVAIAIPNYMEYTQKAKYTEVIQAAAAYKAIIATCALVVGGLEECSQGKNGIPIPKLTKNLSLLEIKSGSIRAAGQGEAPLNSTYILSAEYDTGAVSWQVSGSCREAGLC
jgi:type IV pilus assembly protein PilA